MGYKIEPRCMSCVYKEHPYVGCGLIARFFVLDEVTNEVLAGNGGRGYKSYHDAYVAYQWMIKGPAAARARKVEQEMLYEWSRKNRILVDRLDTLAHNYKQEDKELTPHHITMLFNTQKATCPTTPESFLSAYQNKFYKDIVLQRRAQRKKKDERRAKWDLKKRADDFIDSHQKLALLREQFAPHSAACVVDPIKKLIKNSLNDHEIHPLDPNAKDRLNYRYIRTVGPVVSTGQPFRGHEWEVVDKDPNLSPIYDTFGQQRPESIDRIMDREVIVSPDIVRTRLSAQTMIDPISYQVVPVKTTRLNSAQEWNQMAAGAKKRKRLATIEPIADLDPVDDIFELDDEDIDRIVLRSTVVERKETKVFNIDASASQENPVKKNTIIVNPHEWVGEPEESVFKPAPAKKPIDVSELEPKEAKASISMGGNKKRQRPRPEGLPPKKEPPKPKTLKETIQDKVAKFKEEWTVEDEDDEDEEYEIPSPQDILNSITSPFKNFFSAVKNEAERQKQEEEQQRSEKQQAKAAKKQEKQTAKQQKNVSESPAINTQTGDAVIDDISAAISAQIAEKEYQDMQQIQDIHDEINTDDLLAAAESFASEEDDGTLSDILEFEF